MTKKSISSLTTVFVDTGIFIDLLKIDFSNLSLQNATRIDHTRMLFEALSKISRKIIFQTSAINIAELYSLADSQYETMAALLEVTNKNEFEIISFDEKAAVFHKSNLEPILGTQTIKQIKDELNYSTGTGFANIEDRIRKDMMIATTAKLYESDIVLTNDSGMKYLCEKLDLCCHVFEGKKEEFLFNQNDTKIIDFSY